MIEQKFSLSRLYLAMGFCLLGLAAPPAGAQLCDPLPEDTKYMITIEYYQMSQFGPSSIILTFGPFESTWNNTFDYENPAISGDLAQGESQGSTSGPTLAFSLQNLVDVYTPRLKGVIFGMGQRIKIDIYVRAAGAGDPYYVQQTLTGSLEADHGAGPGLTETSFNGTFLGGSGGPYNSPIDHYSGSSGVTSSQTHPSDPNFYYATSISLDASGYVWQSLDFCFPSCPTVYHYFAHTNVEGFIDAGPGPLPCSGRINAPIFTGPCKEILKECVLGFWCFYEVSRSFNVEVDFTGDCRCCEYRQYVKTNHWIKKPSWFPISFRRPVPNCAGEWPNGPCLIEDTKNSHDLKRCVRYGYRSDTNTDRIYKCNGKQSDDYGPGDRSTACTYRSCDAPGIIELEGRQYQMRADFQGQVVVRAGGGCGATERVVAVRNWTVLCSGTLGEGPSTPLSLSADRKPLPPGDTVRRLVELAGRDLYVSFWLLNDQLAATMAIPVKESEYLFPSDVTITIDGMEKWPQDDEVLGKLSSPDAYYAFADYVFVTPACLPPSVSVTIGFDADQISFTQSLAVLASAQDSDGDGVCDAVDLCPGRDDRADLNNDAKIDLNDYTLLQVDYGCTADCTADINGDNQTDLLDLVLFFEAWLCSADL